jgi:Tol biopolymer transport system component
MNASGGALHAITVASDSSSHPDWSPDGTSMVFERRAGGHSAYGTEFYSLNVDGTGLRRLADCREDCLGDSQPRTRGTEDGLRSSAPTARSSRGSIHSDGASSRSTPTGAGSARSSASTSSAIGGSRRIRSGPRMAAGCR